MLDGQIKRHEQRIAEEELLANRANTPDVALAHQKIAMLYRTELSIMRKRRAIAVGETLAQLG